MHKVNLLPLMKILWWHAKVGLKSSRGSNAMHNNELHDDVCTRDYCAITAKVKGERVSRSAHTTIFLLVNH